VLVIGRGIRSGIADVDELAFAHVELLEQCFALCGEQF
jgi:hypothetical protein